MKLDNIVIDSLEYKKFIVIYFYKNYYGYEKYFNKVLILKMSKILLISIEDVSLSYWDVWYFLMN